MTVELRLAPSLDADGRDAVAAAARLAELWELRLADVAVRRPSR